MSKLNKLSILSLILGSVFYWLSFNLIDQPLAHFFHHAQYNAYLYNFFQTVTLLGDSRLGGGFIIVSFILAIIILFKQPQNKFANTLLFMGLAMTAAIFTETSLKYLLGRYRPELLFQQGLYGFHYLSHQFLMNSSPSGHATRVFVLVTGASLMMRRLSPIFITLGILVCLSRLVLEFHYLSDVVFGAILGTLVTLWIAKIYYSMTISNSSMAILRSR